MMGHIGAAMMGRTVAKRAGYNGMVGMAIGLAGSIMLRRFMPMLASTAIDGLADKVGLSNRTPERAKTRKR